MNRAGSDTADVAKHAYRSTATALRDSKITARVKIALQDDIAVEHSDIHVRTMAGVVTLTGQVPSSATASRVELLTLWTEGVRHVDSKLIASDAAVTD